MKLLLIISFLFVFGSIYCQTDSVSLLPITLPLSKESTLQNQIRIVENTYLGIANSKITFENGKYQLVTYYLNNKIQSVTDMSIELYIDSTFSFSTNFDTLTIICESRVILVKNGEFREWYESGNLKIEGTFSNDFKNGNWIYYDLNGEIIKQEN